MGYTYTRQPDGRYRVHDVEVFATHRRTFGTRELEVDRSWLDQALAAYRQRSAEGYEPPLTINGGLHASASRGGKAQNAGTYELTRVAPGQYNGEPVEILYADLIVDEDTKLEIERGGLPYRSCESLDPFDRPEIDAIALLDVDTPYFRFPVLKLNNQEAAVVASARGGAAMAWAARPAEAGMAQEPLVIREMFDQFNQQKYFGVFHPGIGSMIAQFPTRAEAERFKREYQQSDVGKRTLKPGWKPGYADQPKQEALTAMDGDKSDDMTAMDGGGSIEDAQAKAAEAGDLVAKCLTDIAAKLEEVLGMLGGKTEEIPDVPEEAPVEGDLPPADEGAPLVSRAPMSDEVAQMRGRLEALERKNAALEQEKIIASAVDRTLEELAPYGWTPSDRETLLDQARKGGEPALAAYAAGVKQAGELPPAWGTQKVDTRQQEPASVAAYSALGPDGLARARQHAARYNGYGARAEMLGDLDTYVRAQMRADGYDVDQVAGAAGK